MAHRDDGREGDDRVHEPAHLREPVPRIALRPAWHSGDDAQGILEVVMTGSASDALDCSGTSVTQHDARISRSGSTT